MDDMGSAIGEVVNTIISKSREELVNMPATELDRFWYFKYDPTATAHWNLYQFYSMLELYRYKCRQWEEMHNGYTCVVERVRDTYLMPKIKQFLQDQSLHRGQ